MMVIACGCATSASAGGIAIAENGTARCAVVVAADATSSERYAADELVRFLRQVTGADIPLAHEVQPNVPNLFVGPKAAKRADPAFSAAELGTDGIAIRTVGKDLVLAGGEPRGSLYAVYTFLEDQAGCRWWTPSVSTIPRRPTLTVGDLDVCYVPVLEYRDMQFRVNGDWSARNKVNGYEQKLEDRHGGRKFNYIAHNKWSSHTFWTVLPPEIYFREHPEYYSLIDGERVHKVPRNRGTSLCLTSEAVRREFVQNSKLALNWHPWADLYSISQIDEGGEPNRCQCASCVAVERDDNPSGLIMQFVNAVAAELKQDFPHVTFDTLAYHYSQAPPRKTLPRDDVIVRLSTIGCSFNALFSQARDDNPRHNQFRDDLVGWSRMSSRLYVWDYAVNFTYHLLPHPNLRSIGPNIRYLVEHNVKGLFEESGTPVAEMEELRAWLLARLMWDPAQDTQALIEEFCRGYYGAAGPELVAYLDVTHDAVAAAGDYLGLSSPPDAAFLSFDTLSGAWAHLQRAADLVNADPALSARVEKARIPVLYVFLCRWDALRREAEAAGAAWPMPDAVEDVYARIKQLAARHGINLKSMSSPIPF